MHRSRRWFRLITILFVTLGLFGSFLPLPLPFASETSSVPEAQAAGATYYVATTGNDGNPGTLSQPFRTVQRGVNALSGPGDTLYIRAGNYVEGVAYPATIFGTASAPITIAGYPGDARPIVRPPSGWNSFAWWVQWDATKTPRHLVMRDFDIEGIDMYSGGDPSWACVRLEAPYVTLDNMKVRNCPGGCRGLFLFAPYLAQFDSFELWAYPASE